MDKTDREVLELCKAWFEDIYEGVMDEHMGTDSHGSRAIHGIAKNYAEYVYEHLHNRWKPSDEQIKALDIALRTGIQIGTWEEEALKSLKEQLKKLK